MAETYSVSISNPVSVNGITLSGPVQIDPISILGPVDLSPVTISDTVTLESVTMEPLKFGEPIEIFIPRDPPPNITYQTEFTQRVPSHHRYILNEMNQITRKEMTTAERMQYITLLMEFERFIRVPNQFTELYDRFMEFMEWFVDLITDEEKGIVYKQHEGVTPGFNRAMLISALREQMVDVMKELNNPTTIK